jgi:hypothetical protein
VFGIAVVLPHTFASHFFHIQHHLTTPTPPNKTRITVPALKLSMVVQRLVDLERRETAAALKRVAELEAQLAAAAALKA